MPRRSMWSVIRVCAVTLGAICVAAWAASGTPAAAAPEALPLPVNRTAILRKDGAVYFIEGRVQIPAGIEVTILNDIRIIGRGPDATIEVVGTLVVHGVGGREVVFENVTVEPQADFKEVHMDMAIFEGGGVKSPKDVSINGHLFLELFDFVRGALLDVRVASGSVELSSVCAETPIKIAIVPPDGATDNKVKVNVRGCGQGQNRPCEPHVNRVGLKGGLDVSGANEIVVRSTRVSGALCAIRNWRKSLIFDACKIQSSRLEVTHNEAGKFVKAQFAKCDIYSPVVLFRAPIKKGKKDTAKVQRFYFGGEGDPKVVLSEIIEDKTDDPEKNGVRVKLDKVKTRAHAMAGPAE